MRKISKENQSFVRSIPRKLLSFSIALGLLTPLPQITNASADEWHGQLVMGRILETYKRLGGHHTFGNATTPERDAARGGKFQVFEKNSSIYWHPQVSAGVAHQVGGRIRDKWRDYGWERGHLGYPTTDENPTLNRYGRYNHFENGSIYWSPATDAHLIQGKIRDRWAIDGWERSELGYPVTDEGTTPDKIGRYNHFQNGSIYWSPSTGSQKIKGNIREYWKAIGWEKSSFGYPISEESFVSSDAVQQNFQNGSIQWVWKNNRSLPKSPGDSWGNYEQFHRVFEQQGGMWTPQAANREITHNFNKYFTFSGCPDVLAVGARCNLQTQVGLDAPIRVSEISDDGFSFISLPGHPEGAGRTITFTFEDHKDDGNRDLWLHVRAWGPVGGASYLGPFNEYTVAASAWKTFSSNINRKISSSSTIYLTEDNFSIKKDRTSGKIRSRRETDQEQLGKQKPVELKKMSAEELEAAYAYERNLETAGGSPKTSNTPNIENPTTGEVSTPPSGDSTLTSDAILTSEPDEVEPATQTTAPGTVQDNVILEPKNRREDLGTLQ